MPTVVPTMFQDAVERVQTSRQNSIVVEALALVEGALVVVAKSWGRILALLADLHIEMVVAVASSYPASSASYGLERHNLLEAWAHHGGDGVGGDGVGDGDGDGIGDGEMLVSVAWNSVAP